MADNEKGLNLAGIIEGVNIEQHKEKETVKEDAQKLQGQAQAQAQRRMTPQNPSSSIPKPSVTPVGQTQNNDIERTVDVLGTTLNQLLDKMKTISNHLNHSDTWLLLMTLKVEELQGMYVTFSIEGKKEIADEWLTKLQSVLKTINVVQKKANFTKNVPPNVYHTVNEITANIEDVLVTCVSSIEDKYNNELGSYLKLFD